MRAFAGGGWSRGLSLAIVLALLAAACSSATPSPTGPTQASGPGATGSPGIGSPAPNFQPLPPSRQLLISEALAAGRIDLVTSLVYRAQALFGLPELPAEFAGAPSRGDDTALFDEIVDLLPTLAPADQARLRPFVVRPTEPDSVFSSARLNLIASLSGALPVAASGGQCSDWADSADADTRFKVWACKGSDPAAAAGDIATVAALMEEIWGPMTQVPPAGMGPPIPDGSGSNVSREYGGDGRIDIYLLSSGETVYRDGPQGISAVAAAVASPPYIDASGAPVKTSSAFMLVNRARIPNTDGMKRDLIHEFFHVLQKAHNLRGPRKGAQDHWFVEASATWAETHYLRPTSEVVHTWFQSDFQPKPVGLESPVEGHDYAAYIWPFFMEMEANSGAPVFNAWVAIEAAASGDFKAVTDAIDKQLPFATRFRDFAVRNLNEALSPADPPLKRYHDYDANFPDGITPVPLVEGTITPSEVYTSPTQSIEPLAATYFYLQLAGETRDVTIDIAGLVPGSNLDGDAILHIGDHWERRPVTGGSLHLCRDTPADAADQFYLVLSNHGRDVPIKGTFEVRPKKACSVGHYSIDVANVAGGTHKGAGHHEGDGQVACAHANGAWVVSAVYFPNDPDYPGRDIAAFDITTTPGHEWVEVTMMDHTTDNPFDWSVMPEFQGTFSFTIGDAVSPVTIRAVADDPHEHVVISATCSTLDTAP
jgi:hypothetical protein